MTFYPALYGRDCLSPLWGPYNSFIFIAKIDSAHAKPSTRHMLKRVVYMLMQNFQIVSVIFVWCASDNEEFASAFSVDEVAPGLVLGHHLHPWRHASSCSCSSAAL